MKHRNLLEILVLVTSTMLLPTPGWSCPITGPNNTSAQGLNDPLFELLQLEEACPKDVLELRAMISAEGGTLSNAMVANRGFHNPGQGSFSFFETFEIATPVHLKNPVSPDEIYFGHFTAPASSSSLTLDQNPTQSSLMVELIAWDRTKSMYNFYELLGSNQGSKWFYRGDSGDIWKDTESLHLARSVGQPVFGTRLRCSGCHVAGGPIMKEISEPHDSWWRADRKLPLGGRTPDSAVTKVMKDLQNPEVFRDRVVFGLARLMNGPAFAKKQAQSPQIALRPLFCPEELNLSSSPSPFDTGGETFYAPADFFADERLGGIGDTTGPKQLYIDALRSLKGVFPETNRIDGDHAWLSPVKASSDKFAIEKLLNSGVSDFNSEFTADVLAVDLTRPVFSKKRCDLVKLLPSQWTTDWKLKFQSKLEASTLPGAQELVLNLVDPERNRVFHETRTQKYLDACSQRLSEAESVVKLVSYLDQVRSEIGTSEISKNPRGQILEPGFRVIFPKMANAQMPGKLTLNENCEPKPL